MIRLNYSKSDKSGQSKLFDSKQMSVAEVTVLYELYNNGSFDIDEFRKKHAFDPLLYVASINITLASLGLKVICYGESLDLEELRPPSTWRRLGCRSSRVVKIVLPIRCR